MAADLCGQRVPESRTNWIDVAHVWRQDHHDRLQALAQARGAIEGKLNTVGFDSGSEHALLDWPQYVMFRARAVSLVMYGLAGANDTKAAQLCDSLRNEFLDRRKIDQSFAETQNAVNAALSALTRR